MDLSKNTIVRIALFISIGVIAGLDLFTALANIGLDIYSQLFYIIVILAIIYTLLLMRHFRSLVILIIILLYIGISSINATFMLYLLIIVAHILLVFVLYRYSYLITEQQLRRGSSPLNIITSPVNKTFSTLFIDKLLILILCLFIIFMVCFVLYSFIYKWSIFTSYSTFLLITTPYILSLCFIFQKFISWVTDETIDMLDIISARNDKEYISNVRSYMIELAYSRGIKGYKGGVELSFLKTLTTILTIAIALIIYYPFVHVILDLINPYPGASFIDAILMFLIDVVISLPMIHGFRSLFENLLSKNLSLRALILPIMIIIFSLALWLLLYIFVGS